MTVAEFTGQLKKRISPEEAALLRKGTDGLCVSAFNRDVCLRLLDAEISMSGESGTKNSTGRDAVDPDDAARLEADLASYLNEYMADRPGGHKWIILACLYLTFAERLPMHPQSAAKWIEKDGRFYCRYMEEDSVTCRYCMCEKLKDEI
ncbi:MAG: hypothetical protein IJM61_06420 [Firmicutes bacterium]|nr:hypothetical protein [Bacillota bacterium]